MVWKAENVSAADIAAFDELHRPTGVCNYLFIMPSMTTVEPKAFVP
jgi:hypothetical protein